MPAYVGRIAGLLVTTLFRAVALGNALAAEVANVRLDRAVVLALPFVRHTNVRAARLTRIAVRSTIEAAHRSIDLRTTAPLADALVLRAPQDAFLANPAHGTVAILVAHAFAEVFQTLHELVRRGEAALSVLLPLARGLLVALVHGTPFAGACDVHALFDAKLVAAPCAYTAFAGWLFAIALVPNPYAGARGLTGVDVISAVTSANWLEDARAIAASRARNAPVCVWVRGEAGRIGALVSAFTRSPRGWHARVANEAIVGRLTMHRLFATAAVLDVMLAEGSVLDRLGLAVLAATEPRDLTRTITARLTTAGNRHSNGADDYTS